MVDVDGIDMMCLQGAWSKYVVPCLTQDLVR